MVTWPYFMSKGRLAAVKYVLEINEMKTVSPIYIVMVIFCWTLIIHVQKNDRKLWHKFVAKWYKNKRYLHHSDRVLVGKPEGKRPLGRPRLWWVDNIRMDPQEVRCGCMDWIGLTQDRDRWRTLVSAVMNLRVPWNAGDFLTSCKPVSFSRRTLHRGVSK